MKDKSLQIQDYIIKIRRRIHENPELGYKEFETSKLIQRELDIIGINYKTGIAKTGVLATIKKGKGPNIMLRADMDALPITEKTNLSFASKNIGCMHACGHDSHVAMLLGAIKLLVNKKFKGTINFLFQPSEEGNYDDIDGLSGAARAIKEGLLQNIDCAIGLHQVPNIPSGFVAIDEGAIMAASDFFKITVKGKSAHAGAGSEEGIDSIVIASQLIITLQTIISRQINAKDTAVISVTKIKGGVAENIIAEETILKGTTRALSETMYQNITELIKKKCEAFALMYDTNISYKITHKLPVTTNNPKVTNIINESGINVFGKANVLKGISTMGGEDFGNISQKIPSCFVFLGTKVNKGEVYPIHNSKMMINEDALFLGSAFLAQSALDLLEKL